MDPSLALRDFSRKPVAIITLVSLATAGRPSMDNGKEFGKVEGAHGIFTIRSGDNIRGWNGIRYKSGLSAKNVGAKKLSMNVATIPPGGVAYAHIHVGFEVMLYILAGRVRHEYGAGLKKVVDNQAGDFIYIEP